MSCLSSEMRCSTAHKWGAELFRNRGGRCTPVDLGVWMAQFMFISEEDELAEAELRGTTPG